MESRNQASKNIHGMKIIAHRGGMGRGMQNTPDGVRLAVARGADLVELDVVRGMDGRFHCAHGLGRQSLLGDCLAEMAEGMGLIAHLKGRYEDDEVALLVEEIGLRLEIGRVCFASHRGETLERVGRLFPEARLARFGFFPAVAALWKQPRWECCMVNHAILTRWHVEALQRRGMVVFASCVWEVRGRRTVERLGVDGAFVNLYE